MIIKKQVLFSEILLPKIGRKRQVLIPIIGKEKYTFRND